MSTIEKRMEGRKEEKLSVTYVHMKRAREEGGNEDLQQSESYCAGIQKSKRNVGDYNKPCIWAHTLQNVLMGLRLLLGPSF